MDMDKQSNNNINEIKLLVLQLARQFNKKFDEQARVIVEQRDQLESQQEQIHNQRAIIEELAWQLRDLRDSVRKCSEKISNVHSKYHTVSSNAPDENHLKLIIPEANAIGQSNHRAAFSPIYESINFDAGAVAAATAFTSTRTNNNHNNTTTPTIANVKSTQPVQPVNPLLRQNAFDSIDGADKVVKREQTNERDVRDFLNRCIPPPPPITSPPHDMDSDTEDQNDPVQISHHTLEKLNSLYSLYKMRRSTTNGTVETDETDETDNVVLRLRKFDKCSSRLFRGSSKAMCSFVSNVEDDYLPLSGVIKNKGTHYVDDDDDDNGFANSTANEMIENCSNDAHCRRQQQKAIHTQNDEFYI